MLPTATFAQEKLQEVPFSAESVHLNPPPGWVPVVVHSPPAQQDSGTHQFSPQVDKGQVLTRILQPPCLATILQRRAVQMWNTSCRQLNHVLHQHACCILGYTYLSIKECHSFNVCAHMYENNTQTSMQGFECTQAVAKELCCRLIAGVVLPEAQPTGSAAQTLLPS